jgi:hypothetical protein
MPDPIGARQDTWSVSVSVDDVDYGVWDKKSGGNADSEETKYKPGGMAPEITLGGSQSVENVTLSRLYDLNRDHQIISTLLARRGRAPAVVKQQPLDHDGNVFGSPVVFRGVLKAVNVPDVDSEGNDAAMVEIEISTAATVA